VSDLPWYIQRINLVTPIGLGVLLIAGNVTLSAIEV
jgi:hypothetical protein